MYSFFVSLGRGTWLALSFSLIALIYFFPQFKEKSVKYAVIFGLLSVAAVGSIFLFSNIFKGGYWEYTGIYKPLKHEKRADYYIQAAIGFINYPITGSGLDTFRYISKKYQSAPSSWSWYVHNHFLQIFAETGVIGGFTFLAFFSVLFFKTFYALRKEKDNIEQKIIYIILVFSLVKTFIDYDWQFISVFLTVFMGFGLIYPKGREIQKTDSRPLYFFAIT